MQAPLLGIHCGQGRLPTLPSGTILQASSALWPPAQPEEHQLVPGSQFPHLSNKEHNLPHLPLAGNWCLLPAGEPHFRCSLSVLVIVLITLHIKQV